MSTDTILLDIANGVARIVLNRPDKLNSFNDAMHKALADAIVKAQTDSNIRCVLICASGRAFCAGQDLGNKEDGELDVGKAINNYYNPLIKAITGMDKPVICAVNGVAAGAGANLALACDIVIAAKSASFIQAFSKIGLVPDAGGTWILPRLIGQARATGVAMLGTKISAEKAESWGMIWQCVEDDALKSTTEQLALNLAQQATTGLAYTKKLMQLSWQNPISNQLELELQFQKAAATTEDYQEGVDAFLNKRKAHFSGK
jgi:2-(1,2-epoxy-1,2-dihydrophenyl)acetyl-CoA isomerase